MENVSQLQKKDGEEKTAIRLHGFSEIIIEIKRNYQAATQIPAAA